MHGASVLDWYAYGYDRNSDRMYRENVLATDRSEVYSYDSLSRLTSMNRGTLNTAKTAVTGTPARQQDWTLTQTGNWAGFNVAENGQAILNQTRTNNKANEITGLSEPESQTQWVVPQYDARGNMITMPKPDSPASGMTCVYDAWNRMVAAKNSDGTVIGTYAYDGLNRRITKTVSGTVQHAYYNSGWQLLETRKTSDPEAAPEDLNPEYQFVWSVRYIDALVLRDENRNGDGDCTDAEDQRLFYLNDANMNVTALADASGAVVERYAHDPYGKPSFFDANWNARAASAYANDILYCGYRFDNETGLYSVRRRYYHPTLGQWITRDPLGYMAETNLYSYVGSKPIVALDASGLAEEAVKACNAKITVTLTLIVLNVDVSGGYEPGEKETPGQVFSPGDVTIGGKKPGPTKETLDVTWKGEGEVTYEATVSVKIELYGDVRCERVVATAKMANNTIEHWKWEGFRKGWQLQDTGTFPDTTYTAVAGNPEAKIRVCKDTSSKPRTVENTVLWESYKITTNLSLEVEGFVVDEKKGAGSGAK